MADKSVSDFYDKFSDFQQKISYNERHFLMLDKLIDLGLARSSHVLELGCGIGIVSSLILGVVKDGHLTGVDISGRSIDLARARNAGGNARFEAADVTTFAPEGRSYDFVTLFDVLEHVPVESHRQLLATVAGCLRDSGKLLVNIPNPDYLAHLHRVRPETLQIIDQPLSIVRLLSDTEASGLVLRNLVHHDLWCRNESVFMWFERWTPFVEVATRAPQPTLLRRLQNKLQMYW